MTRLMIAAALSIAFAAPVPAQDASYYIVRDATTKKCTVTHERPTTSSVTVVSGNTVYKTQMEAESAIKTTKVCTDE
jgi:hypothetical protein